MTKKLTFVINIFLSPLGNLVDIQVGTEFWEKPGAYLNYKRSLNNLSEALRVT